MKRIFVALALVALAGCGRDSSQTYPSEGLADQAVVARAGDYAATEEKLAAAPANEVAPAPVAGVPPPPPPGQPPPAVPGTPPGGVMLAYAYTYGIETPSQRVTALMKHHEDECAKAGANLCQVLGSSTDKQGENNISGQLLLRAEPRWLTTFRGKLDSDAKNAGGELKSSAVTSEDLTRQIIDTEAHLRAQRSLRERLQQLLATRPGRLSDLLDTERELARVQGEIDAADSNLAVMKTRVSMSTATLNYASADAPLTDRTFEPIKNALTSFVRIVAEVIGFMIQAVAVILPWLLLLWLVVWLLRGWMRRRRARKAAVTPTTPA